ncbi:hypothetical protein [Clostridium tyrobutyricum]|uniref:hypothetical protein n=1 Tax=Clostridium tyrobutyricum TaxID=1519 RepID=UPI0011CA13A1|nr:hypothetical protein [Clostridium tyrobutyricum]
MDYSDDIATLIVDITKLLENGCFIKKEDILSHIVTKKEDNTEKCDVVEYLINKYMSENDDTKIKMYQGNEISKNRIKKLDSIIYATDRKVNNIPYKNGLHLLIALLAIALKNYELIMNQQKIK